MKASAGSTISLTGTSVCFDRAGRHVLVMEDDGIAVIDIAGSQTTRLPHRDARAIAGFDDQLWIVTQDCQLARVDPTGRPLDGPPMALPFTARGVLVSAPYGPAAAVWSGPPPTAVIDEPHGLVRIEHPRCDLVLPLAGRRCVTVAGSQLTLPSGQIIALAPSSTVLGGVALTDGKRLALLVAPAGARGGERQLIIVSLTTAQIAMRCAVQSTEVRIATERGLALAQLEPGVFWAVDLRTGRELGVITLDREVAAYAIDPGGRWLAVRGVTGEVELLSMADAVRTAAAIGTIGSGPPAARSPEVDDPAAAVATAASPAARGPGRASVELTRNHRATATGGAARTAALAQEREAVRSACTSRAARGAPRDRLAHGFALPTAAARDLGLRPANDRHDTLGVVGAVSVDPGDDTAGVAEPPIAASLAGQDPDGDTRALPGALDQQPTVAASGESDGAVAVVRAPGPVLSRAWLDAEIERIWLSAEAELRRLQQLQLRPSVPEIESVLAERRAARVGKPSPFDGAELSGALDAVLHRLPELRQPAIDVLSGRLGLTPSDIAALLIVAAPSIDPPLADLFAAVRGPVLGRRGVDLAMIGQLLSCGRDRRIELLDVLDEHRAPVAHRLIQIAPAEDVYSSASYRSIQPTHDLLWLLMTTGDTSSPSLRGCASVVRAAASWRGLVVDDELRASLDPLAQRFTATTAALPWVALWGAPGAGKREIAARLAAFSGRPLLSVEPRAQDHAQLLELVRRACRDADWLDAALYLGPFGADQLHDQPQIARELERCQAPVLLGFDSLQAPRLRTTSPLVEYALPLPLVPARIALWNRALAGMTIAPGTDVANIARGYKLTPGEILDAGREVAALAGRGAVDAALLRKVMERRLRNELGAVATRLVVDTSWDDVVLPVEAIARVRELISRKNQEDLVYRGWRLDQRIGYGKGIIALFSGPPGTGKTLLAGLIAKELGYELYQIDLSQVFSRWIGETEKALDKVFDQAERAHAVLLFDEADALFAKRTAVEDSNDRYANVAVNFLLQRLERYSGVAVLTTNKESYLDEALRRRLNLHLQLDKPDAVERLKLWRKHLPMTVPGAGTVDIASLATDYELTGGYIKNVAVRATFLSAAENVPLSTQQIRRAASLELEDLGRVVTWPARLDDQHRSRIEVVDYAER